ncbi:MAG: cytochrome c biogenesis protein CcsA [Planctomycetota bacterium]
MTPTGDLPLAGWLLLLTLATFTASALAWRRLAFSEPSQDKHGAVRAQCVLQAAVLAGLVGALAWRWTVHEGPWRPISAHIDGLLLLAVAAAASILFLQFRAGFHGVAAFALPLLGLILTWGICAAAWSYDPFSLDARGRAWLVLHQAGIYLGGLGALLAAAAGLAYLYARKRLLSGGSLSRVPVLSSLESLERLVIVGSTVGFSLLSIGLASGIGVAAERSNEIDWWREPKATLGLVSWLGYGLVMNARLTSVLRGTPAAVTAVVGFAVLIGAYAAAEAWPHRHTSSAATPAVQPASPSTQEAAP